MMEYAKKRQFERVPYTGTVTINNSISAKCRDISEGGLFVHLTPRNLLPGSMVRIQFSTGLTVMAVVQVVSSNGAGLMFTGLKADQAAGIKAAVGRLREEISVRKPAPETRPESRPETTTETTTETAPEPQPESQPSVLMVEDSESVRQLARKSLEAEGLNVLEASDGMAALKLLGKEVPDLILLDLHMERMDGYKLLSFVKQIDHLKELPVLVFSSKYSAEEQAKVKALGADDFLPKMTTSPAKLVSIVKRLISRKRKLEQKKKQQE